LLRDNKTKAISALVVASLFSALMGVVIKTFNQEGISIFTQLYLRVLGGFVLGFLIYGRKLRFSVLCKEKFTDLLMIFVRSVLFYIFGAVLFVLAFLNTKFANVSSIQAIPLTAIVGFWLFKEKITFWKVFFVALSFVGTLFIGLQKNEGGIVFGMGELFAILSVFAFSFAFVSRKWYKGNLNNFEIAQVMMFVGFVLLFAVSMIAGETFVGVFAFSRPMIAALFFGSIFQTFNLVVYNFAFKNLDNVIASNLMTLELIFGIMVGFIVYSQLPNTAEIFGALLIFVGALFINITNKS
jgi:drug/metabolite transporter (DMT)-like permease